MGREAIGHADFVVLEDMLGALTNGDDAGSALVVDSRDDDVVPIWIEGVGVDGLGSFVRVARRGGVVKVDRRDVALVLVESPAGTRQCLREGTLLRRHGRRRDVHSAL